MGLVSASGDLLQGEGAGGEWNLPDGESGALWKWSQPCMLARPSPQAQLNQSTAGVGKNPLPLTPPFTTLYLVWFGNQWSKAPPSFYRGRN